MAWIKKVNGAGPTFGNNCWLAENATVVGDVEMGADCSVWFGAVIRGDVNKISLGNRVNVQDGAIIHCTYGKTDVKIGDDVSIGHRAIVHGCKIDKNVLIGMGAIVMDNVVVESAAIIAAGAVVLENTVVEAGSVWAGVPAKKVKQMEIPVSMEKLQKLAASYVHYKSWFL